MLRLRRPLLQSCITIRSMSKLSVVPLQPFFAPLCSLSALGHISLDVCQSGPTSKMETTCTCAQTRNWSLVVARKVARHWHQDGSPLWKPQREVLRPFIDCLESFCHIFVHHSRLFPPVVDNFIEAWSTPVFLLYQGLFYSICVQRTIPSRWRRNISGKCWWNIL